MGLVLTGTAGLLIWIVLWSLDVSGFDSILIAVLMVLVSLSLRNVIPNLLNRRQD